MPPLNQLKAGQKLRLRLSILPARVASFKHAKECDDVGGGLMPGTELEVVEVRPAPGEQWARLRIPGSDPAKHLKLTGGEMASLLS
jgi:hypothetical protein